MIIKEVSLGAICEQKLNISLSWTQFTCLKIKLLSLPKNSTICVNLR